MSAAKSLPTPVASCDELKTWLEWAGAKLLSLRIGSPSPKGPNVSWPEFASDVTKAYGYTAERLRAAVPEPREIELMDEILLLPSFVVDVTSRRIVHARSLVTPVANRYLYSWTRLGFMLHVDPRKVARLHHQGLVDIALRANAVKIDAIRQSYHSLSI